jgi:pyruvate kinase
VYEPNHPEDWEAFVRRWLARYQVPGDMAILTEGPSMKHPDAHNRMEIINLNQRVTADGEEEIQASGKRRR